MGVPTARPIFRLLPMLALPLLFLACEEQGSVAPPDPELASGGPGAPGSCPPELEDDIRELFEAGEETAALGKCSTIDFQAGKGNFEDALEQAVAFADWATDLFEAGDLADLGSPATEEVLADVLTAIFLLAGSDLEIPAGAFGEDGFVEIVDENGGTVVCENLKCGIDFLPGTFDGPTVVYAVRLPDESDPLFTSLVQIPRFYDMDASQEPALEFVAGVCADDNALPQGVLESDLRLGHNIDAEQRIEILPLEAAPFLDCDAPELVGSLGERLWNTIASGAGRLLGVRPLHASAAVRPGPLGGRALSFSAFGAVVAEGDFLAFSPGASWRTRWLYEDLGGDGCGSEDACLDQEDSELTAFGQGPFGDFNADLAGSCPELSLSGGTQWGLNGTLLLRKTVSLPLNPQNVRVWVAFDNDVRVFWNGTEIGTSANLVTQQSGGIPLHTSANHGPVEDPGTDHETTGFDQEGFLTHEGCAAENDVAFQVPGAQGGDNVLELLVRDRGGANYADVRVTAELGGGLVPIDG